jgi:DNA-binding LacI/PurR family transcriptional regulator
MHEKTALRTITRADIAKEAEVSETIVSYVINGNRYVNSEKRKRVEQAIAKLKYRPNALARALKGKKLNHLLFVADDIQGDYFSKLIGEIDGFAYEENYFISLCADHMDEDFVDRIYSRFFDGIIIGSANFPLHNIQRLVNTTIPIVLLEVRDYSSITGVYGLINTGLYQGARACVRSLHERGRRNLLYLDKLNKDGSRSDLSDWRLKGFYDQMEEYGLPVSERNVIAGCRSDDELVAALEQRVRHDGFVPDGIFGRNDYMALLGMEAAKGLGYDVPTDISIIGFDNSRFCRFSTPTLSSVEIQQKEIGRAIMKMMIALIDRRDSFSTRIEEHLETRLVLRSSI